MEWQDPPGPIEMPRGGRPLYAETYTQENGTGWELSLFVAMREGRFKLGLSWERLTRMFRRVRP